MIPGGNEIWIRFTRHNPSFSLHSKSTDNSAYIINTDAAMLMVRQCDIAPHIIENHLKTLQRDTLKFPINKIRMKFFTRGSGRNDLSQPNIVNGVLPERVVIGFVKSGAFSGKLNTSPFNLKDFGVTSIVLHKNGNLTTHEQIDLDYSKNIYQQAYHSLIHVTGKLNLDQGFDMTSDEYSKGYVLYGFNLSNSVNENDSFNLINEGKLGLGVKLSASSTVSITTVVFLQYQSLIEIDKTGEVITSE